MTAPMANPTICNQPSQDVMDSSIHPLSFETGWYGSARDRGHRDIDLPMVGHVLSHSAHPS